MQSHLKIVSLEFLHPVGCWKHEPAIVADAVQIAQSFDNPDHSRVTLYLNGGAVYLYTHCRHVRIAPAP
jgi:hypothetical protein